ncbi:MAG TPA: hypothetical protein VJ302_30345 [Blastocatellia bacterium]|nr:hypothetical protein [Blastocatellia bacterium]
MRPLRNFTTAIIFTGLMVAAIFNSGCNYIHKVIAKDKLNQGAILYNQGRIKQAQNFFREATETDPSNAVAWLYYGATLVRDYRDLEGDKKTQTAGNALQVYEKALSLSGSNCVNRDNAITYIASIYDDLKNDDEWRKWLLNRADDKCATPEVKATSYYSIAVRYWRCSYDQTERYQDRAKMASDAFHYRNMDYPAALADKQKAMTCATKGLEFVEKALAVNPEYVDAMFYKALLYRELQKLTKEEAKRKEMERTALKINDDAAAVQRRRQAEQPTASPERQG